MSGRFLIYGATGYTGRLICDLAVDRGLRPVVAGRNPESVGALAEETGFEARPCRLDRPRELAAALEGISLVLHCAGPFSSTSAPMVDACLGAGAHYLDITGEIDVFEALAARSAEAKSAGVMLLPGVGFDVVPSDCLAAHVAARLPDAGSLRLAMSGMTGASRGTLKTAVEGVGGVARSRRDGKIAPMSAAEARRPRRFDFGEGPRDCLPVSWGDVSTAFHTTGIPNVEVCFESTRQLRKMAAAGALQRWLLSTRLAQVLIKRRIDRMPAGPSEERRERSRTVLVAEAENEAGAVAASRLVAPEGYTLTARTALTLVQRVLDGGAEPGFQTPAGLFGEDFILEIEGCRREDLPG